MSEAVSDRFWPLDSAAPPNVAQLRVEYTLWHQAKAEAYNQILQFYQLTGTLPVVGDTLTGRDSRGNILPDLLIEKRNLFSVDLKKMVLVYDVSVADIEEYQESAFEKETE